MRNVVCFVLTVMSCWAQGAAAQSASRVTHAKSSALSERLITAGDSTKLSKSVRSAVRARIVELLRDPHSLQDFEISQVNAIIVNDSILAGNACGRFNARNGFGGFAGRAYFVVRLRGAVNDSQTASDTVLISDEDDANHRNVCFDLGARETAPWLGSISNKTVFRRGCLASRLIQPIDQKYFWLLSSALSDGYSRSEAPGC